MKKLKLEALEITSFETLPRALGGRGTLNAHQVQAPPSLIGPCYPTDPNFDCTYGCTQNTGCPGNCEPTLACP